MEKSNFFLELYKLLEVLRHWSGVCPVGDDLVRLSRLVSSVGGVTWAVFGVWSI